MTETSRVFRLTSKRAFWLYIVIDIICVGMGMGIPIFNILFGFVVGWYLIKWISISPLDWQDILRRLLVYACVTAVVTFIGMALLWGPSAKLLFDPHADIARFGIPFVLYEPRASLVGWLVLMILISPFLQMLTTVFAGNLTLLILYRRHRKNEHLDGTA